MKGNIKMEQKSLKSKIIKNNFNLNIIMNNFHPQVNFTEKKHEEKEEN